LNHLKIDWPDWERFKADRLNFEWTPNEKKNGKSQFRFIDARTKHEYSSRVENIHKCLIEHARIVYDYDNYSRHYTRGLINCLEIGVSNFFFRECKTPMADGLIIFLNKLRADIQFTSNSKKDILNQVNRLYS
jgi:hypothetical protein